MVLALVGLTGAVLVWPGSSAIHRIAGPVHERLALGPLGNRIVIAASLAAVLLNLSGLVLWWRRKNVSVRLRSGWIVAFSDIHHTAGILSLPLMILLGATAVGIELAAATGDRDLVRFIVRLHTSRGFSMPIKVLYAIGSLAFCVQAVTGLVMWWKSR
jgi:uncharacterized iron-regulated membrane protein